MNLTAISPSLAAGTGLAYAPAPERRAQSDAFVASFPAVGASNSGPEQAAALTASSISPLTANQIATFRYLSMAEALRRLVGGGYKS